MNSIIHGAASRPRLREALLCGVGALALVSLAGCGPVRLVANTNIPTPLVVKMPITVALLIPQDFAQYVHNEERWSTDWQIELGKAQSEGMTRLMSAIFERVVPIESIGAAAAHSGISAILEPSIEEYAFVTPRDAGSPFFAVSIKYRINVYLPDGKLAESWGFTGYGTAPSQGLSSSPPLAAATALAMRDAGAKLAVEFREQAVVRGLLPEGASADVLGKPVQPIPTGSSSIPVSSSPAPGEPTAPGAEQRQEPPATGDAQEQPAAQGTQEQPGDEAQQTPQSDGTLPPPEALSPVGPNSIEHAPSG